MALTAATFAAELVALPLTLEEAVAREGLAAAFRTYMEESTVNGVQAASAPLAAAEIAMEAALVGMSLENAAAIAIQTGITAFWGIVAGTAGAVWVLPSAPLVVGAVPPVGIATLASALTPVFTANIAAKLSREDAADAIAAVIHTANLGGIANVTPPPGTFPIL